MDNLLLSPPITELTTRVANLESELATVKEQIEPLVALPTIIDQNNKEMRKGFTDTQEQLAKLHSLLERVISPNLRPPAKPNPVTSTNQNTPKKLPNH
jgi:septal ring factor EnvC (AmiA/AmiB activator)